MIIFMENNNGFNFKYSAKEQKEIDKIRNKYIKEEESSEENKLERLRRLDAGVEKKSRTVSIIIGVIGALILGTGMSLAMSEFSEILGAYDHLAIPVGIGVGVVGLILAALAYPIYNAILKKERARIAPEILKLTDELMK